MIAPPSKSLDAGGCASAAAFAAMSPACNCYGDVKASKLVTSLRFRVIPSYFRCSAGLRRNEHALSTNSWKLIAPFCKRTWWQWLLWMMATGESGGSTMLASGLATWWPKKLKKADCFAHRAFHSPHDFVEQQRSCQNLLMFTGSTFRTLRYGKNAVSLDAVCLWVL